ncbi:MAG TPA: hypothetical protein PLD47_13895 [Aggregatilineales bacterium]|nr:MAG: hypothetical protein HKUEN02_01100 [Anaerolineaceae bacterium]HRE48814.1 hypothetical protein [Aggregatilineales bacterium]
MRIIIRLLRYLFPPRTPRQKLPLTSIGYSGTQSRYGKTPQNLKLLARALVAANVARDEGHAYMIIRNEPADSDLKTLIRKYKRPRRFRGRLVMAAIRFKRILWAWMILVFMAGAVSVGAQGGVKGTVLAERLPVRECPATDCPEIGELKAGGKFVISGQSAGGSWLFFRYWDRDGWVEYAEADIALIGELATLPIISTRTLLPVVLGSWSIDPIQPAPGQAYTLTLTLQNAGGTDTAGFALGALFPGGHFAYLSVPPLPSGGAGTIRIPAPGEKTTGNQTITVILDMDQVLIPTPDEGQRITIPVRIDRPYRTQGTVTVAPDSNISLEGGGVDLQFADGQLRAGEGVAIQIITDLAEAHYDGLETIEGERIGAEGLKPGVLAGIHTSQKARGVLRIVRMDGEGLTVYYALY